MQHIWQNIRLSIRFAVSVSINVTLVAKAQKVRDADMKEITSIVKFKMKYI